MNAYILKSLYVEVPWIDYLSPSWLMASSSFGMTVRDITAVEKNNFKLFVNKVIMNVSLAVHFKNSIEHIYI
jgi:hypothetical protein